VSGQVLKRKPADYQHFSIMKALLGTKIGMTQIFDEAGNVVPVTVIEAGPCVVTQLKTTEKDGYLAVQLGFGENKRTGKALAGHLKPSGATSRHIKEIRLQEPAEGEEALKIGSKLDVSTFAVGDSVQVTGTSKGKGFAGTIKRHNFSRGPKTHGSRNYRAPGSIGAGYPEHVMKGIKMAGQMGHAQVTTKNLQIALVDAERNVLGIKGSVPGPRKGLVVVRGL
jgi:large subunit ribosomal protein L3